LVPSYIVGHFLQPINDPTSATDPQSVFKLGSTVPVKFQLLDSSGSPVSDGDAAAMASDCQVVLSTSSSAGSAAATNETLNNTTPNTGACFRYDTSAHQFIFNLGTKGLASGVLAIRASVYASDLSTLVAAHTVTLGLK
jgi:hypothetical protein